MNLNDLYEGREPYQQAIDKLEARRIEDLNAKMDDLHARARKALDAGNSKAFDAYRQEFMKAKAERDSYHTVSEAPGAETLSHNQSTVADNENALDLEEHGGGGGGPAQWHAYVKAHRTNEEEVDEHGGGVNGMKNYISWRKKANTERGVTKSAPPVGKSAPSSLPTIPKGTVHGKLDQSKGVVPKASFDEGWQDFNKVEPYAVCLAGKPVKKFDYYEEARRFHDNWKKKLYNQGEKEKADKITLMPLNLDEETMDQAAHKPRGAKFGGYYKGTQIGAPKPGQSFGSESKEMEEGIEGNMTVRSMPLMQPLKKRNPVAKNAIQSGAGQHANNLKKAVAQGRKAKHKAQAIPFDESAQPNFLSWVMEQAEFAGFDKNPAIYESARQAFAEAKISEIKKGQKDSNGNTGCWDGYHAAGTKKGKNGGQVRNCVKNENVEEDWQKANKKDKTDGMSQKAVNAYKKEHPGSKLKTAVTTKPSKLKKGSKASKRRSSYCARSKGQMDMHNISCAKTPDKAICKSRRRWNCESIENLDAMLAEAVKKRDELEQGQYYIWTVYFDDGTDKRVKVTSDQFDAKAYYAKKNKVVVNVDYDWTIHNG